MKELEKYEYAITVTQLTNGFRIQIDNTPYGKIVSQSYGLVTGTTISNLGAFMNYLDTLK